MGNYVDVRAWTTKVKKNLAECFDSKCGICGYNKTVLALDFHHINPNDKKFGISTWKIKKWDRVVEEAKKCVLLCSNCHREIHGNITSMPDNIKRFDENKAAEITKRRKNDRIKIKIKLNKCPICSNMKNERLKYCSVECKAKSQRRFEWDKWDLYDLVIVQNLSMCKIGRLVGVSGNAIRKRLRRLNLPATVRERKEFSPS